MRFASLFFHATEYAQDRFTHRPEYAIALHEEIRYWQDFKTVQCPVAPFSDKKNMHEV